MKHVNQHLELLICGMSVDCGRNSKGCAEQNNVVQVRGRGCWFDVCVFVNVVEYKNFFKLDDMETKNMFKA